MLNMAYYRNMLPEDSHYDYNIILVNLKKGFMVSLVNKAIWTFSNSRNAQKKNNNMFNMFIESV